MNKKYVLGSLLIFALTMTGCQNGNNNNPSSGGANSDSSIIQPSKDPGEITGGTFNFNEDAFYEGVWNKNTTVKARGLFINTNTNEIVARSYDKFFLLDQYSYSTIDNFTAPLVAYKKYDGFLGIVGYDRESDKIIFCSKSTIAPEGIFAELFRKKLEPQINDMEMLKEFLRDNNVSLVFECIAHKEDEHLIKYRGDYCILLDIVHNTIEYKNEEYMGDMWLKDMSLFDTTVI